MIFSHYQSNTIQPAMATVLYVPHFIIALILKPQWLESNCVHATSSAKGHSIQSLLEKPLHDSYIVQADPEKIGSVRDSYNADIESKRSAKRQRYQEDLEENSAAKRQRYQEDLEENHARR